MHSAKIVTFVFMVLAALAVAPAGEGVLAQPSSAPIVPDHVLVAADRRERIDLSGPWTWSIDPYRDGLAGFHGDPAGQGHRRYDDIDVDAATRENPAALYEYDMRRSPVVTLPGSWIAHDPTLRHYDDLVWYQRTFTARPKPGQRAFLRFGAVNYTAHVYFNCRFVGRHDGGFTPFSFEVTELLRDGENQVTVGADAERTADTVPPPVTDWETYGGITRPVSLVFTPATYVDDAWARLLPDGRIEASVRLDGEGDANREVRVAIPELGFTLSGRTVAAGFWSDAARAPARLKRWSPESPTLYEVQFETGGDRLSDRVGFRTVEVRGEDILLNGKPIFLRGICINEE